MPRCKWPPAVSTLYTDTAALSLSPSASVQGLAALLAAAGESGANKHNLDLLLIGGLAAVKTGEYMVAIHEFFGPAASQHPDSVHAHKVRHFVCVHSCVHWHHH